MSKRQKKDRGILGVVDGGKVAGAEDPGERVSSEPAPAFIPTAPVPPALELKPPAMFPPVVDQTPPIPKKITTAWLKANGLRIEYGHKFPNGFRLVKA